MAHKFHPSEIKTPYFLGGNAYSVHVSHGREVSIIPWRGTSLWEALVFNSDGSYGRQEVLDVEGVKAFIEEV